MRNALKALAVLFAVFAMTFVVSACGDHGPSTSLPTGNTPVVAPVATATPNATPAAAAPTTDVCPAGAHLLSSKDSRVKVCELDGDVTTGTCPVLSNDVYSRGKIVKRFGVVNGRPDMIYTKPSMFWDRDGTNCHAYGLNPGGGMTVTPTEIGPGEAVVLTYEIPVSDDTCGTFQGDDTLRGGDGVVIASTMQNAWYTGRVCKKERTCLDVGLTSTTPVVSGTTASFTVSWNGSGKATASLDGGTPTPVSNGQNLVYANQSEGTHQVTVNYTEPGLPNACPLVVKFTISHQRTCTDVGLQGNVSVNGSSATLTATFTGPGPVTYSLDGGSPQSIANNVPVSLGTSLAEGNHSVVLTDNEGGLGCSKTVTFVIQHQRCCADINLQGSVSVNGTSATLTATFNGPGPTTYALDGGAAKPVTSGTPVSLGTSLAEGNHSVVLTDNEGGLGCSKTVTFVIAHQCVNTGIVTLTAEYASGDHYWVFDENAHSIIWPADGRKDGHLDLNKPYSFGTPITGHRLTFHWDNESPMATATATCPAGVQTQWHGTMTFSCACK